MKKQEIKNRIAEISKMITDILESGDNSVNAATLWAKLQKERSELQNMI